VNRLLTLVQYKSRKIPQSIKKIDAKTSVQKEVEEIVDDV
jgi:hypothetical protein